MDDTPIEDNPLRTTHSSRPRAVLNPFAVGQKFSASLQTPILQELARVCPSFIYGLNTEQLADRFNSFIRKGMKCLWFDGTSYDAT